MIHDALLISGPCNRKLERISEDDESHGIGIAWTGRKNIAGSDARMRRRREGQTNTHFLSLSHQQPFLEPPPRVHGHWWYGMYRSPARARPAVVDRGDGCLLAGRVAFLLSGPALLWPHAPWKRPRLGRAAGERAYRTGGRTAKFCGHALRLPN